MELNLHALQITLAQVHQVAVSITVPHGEMVNDIVMHFDGVSELFGLYRVIAVIGRIRACFLNLRHFCKNRCLEPKARTFGDGAVRSVIIHQREHVVAVPFHREVDARKRVFISENIFAGKRDLVLQEWTDP